MLSSASINALASASVYAQTVAPVQSVIENNRPPPMVEKPALLPEKALLPWSMPGIDPRMRTNAVKMLEEAWLQLSQRFTQGNRRFSELPDNRWKAGNATMLGNAIRISNKLSADNAQFLQPVWCKIGNAHVVALQEVDAFTGTIVRAAHHAITLDHPEAALQKDRYSWLSASTANALSAMLSANTNSNLKQLPVKIALERLNLSSRLDRGSHVCLTAVLAERLAVQHRVQAEIGLEAMQHVRWQRNIAEKFVRANRLLAIEWQGPVEKFRPALQLPATFLVNLNYTEAVFGGRTLKERQIPYDVSIVQNRIELRPHATLLQYIAAEDAALQADQPPQTAHIYGAWAYLDQGRAYGLRINDRLVAQNGNDTIKGHVVGFYGAGVKLKSPRGFAIAEGAIVFVRKGQDKTKIGQSWGFDQTEYPTAYPPGGSAAR